MVENAERLIFSGFERVVVLKEIKGN